MENLHKNKIPWEENPGPQLQEQIILQSTFNLIIVIHPPCSMQQHQIQ